MAERRWNFPEETYAAVVTSVVASTLIHGAPPRWHTEPISISHLWKIVSHLLSQISFHCTTYIHYKFHIMDSCCLRHKFNFAATSIADFISDVTDFILTYRVTLMADFILLTTLVSYHSTSYFHHKKLYHRFHFITLRTVIKDIISAHFIYSCWLDHTSFSGHFHCRFHFVCYIIHRLHFTC